MTNAFTPPTSFPHECRDVTGKTVWLYGLSKHPEWDFTYVGELVGGRQDAALGRWGPSLLRDKPKVTSVWENLYPNDFVSPKYSSRGDADRNAMSSRIDVLRRDTIDGVTTYELEGL